MTRSEQVAFCRKCTNRKFDNQQGLICRLTDKKADFQDECPDFHIDHTVEDKIQPGEEEERLTPGPEVLEGMSGLVKDKLRRYQDFKAALIGGVLAALISALFWAVLDVGFGVPLLIQFLTKGMIIGQTVRYFGAGIDQKFGMLGGVLTLVSCTLGIFFTEIGLIARELNVGLLEVIKSFDYSHLPSLADDTINLTNLLLAGVSVYMGYFLSFRGFSSRELSKINSSDFDPIPPNYFRSGNSYKKPAILIAFIMLVGLISLFIISEPTIPGERETLYGAVMERYPDGSQQAQGKYSGGTREDIWSFWYPANGGLKAVGFYNRGIRTSEWTWYSEKGSVLREGHYSRGLKSGNWTNYYQNGRIKDSCQYVNGRQQGTITRFYDTGELMETGTYHNGMAQGLWTLFYKDGQKKSERTIVNGARYGISKVWDETDLPEGSDFEMISAWDQYGDQMVTRGDGFYSEYHNNGELKREGEISNKQKTGTWRVWFPNGNLAEEGEYINGVYYLQRSWTASGREIISDANGNYDRYDASGEYLLERGSILNGLREGTWTTYHAKSDQPMLVANYKEGKPEGLLTCYYPSGSIQLQGFLTGGLKTGKWVAYFEDSTIKSTTLFENGLRHGSRTINNEEGKQLIEETYKSGKLVREKLFIEE